MAKKKLPQVVTPQQTKSWLANKCDRCGCSCSGKWATAGWLLLLFGGLSHMLPTQMAPLLKWSAYGISLQMVVGVLSVLAALYYLLGNEE